MKSAVCSALSRRRGRGGRRTRPARFAALFRKKAAVRAPPGTFESSSRRPRAKSSARLSTILGGSWRCPDIIPRDWAKALSIDNVLATDRHPANDFVAEPAAGLHGRTSIPPAGSKRESVPKRPPAKPRDSGPALRSKNLIYFSRRSDDIAVPGQISRAKTFYNEMISLQK
jgi:hypothetical protein